LKKISKKFYEQNKDRILDVIIFGSFIKGGISPKDIDISIITKTTKQSSEKIAKEFESDLSTDFHVTYHIIEDLFSKDEPIWTSLLHEGFSLVFDKKLLPLKSKVLFTYNSSSLEYTDKIRFYYALKGRDGKSGILAETKTEFLSKGVLIADVNQESEIITFLMNWNLPFKKKRILIE